VGKQGNMRVNFDYMNDHFSTSLQVSGERSSFSRAARRP
jgi:hypothetical protein